MKVSLIENCYKVVNQKSVTEIFEIIRTGDLNGNNLKSAVQKLRDLYLQKDKRKYDGLKKKLPGFTISGKFRERRVTDKIEEYSNLIILDIDNLEPNRVLDIKQLSAEQEFTLMSFISVSGFGLKIVVQVDTDSEYHKLAFEQLRNYYEAILGVKIDSGSDLSRLCFFSYDPNIYMNQHSETFKVSLTDNSGGSQISTFRHENSFAKHFAEAVKQTSVKTEYKEGQRNNFIYLLANNCNRLGIPERKTFDLIHESYDLPINEIEQTIRSAFTHHIEEHGQLINDKENVSSAYDNKFTQSPFIPDEVYLDLPNILSVACSCFDEPRQRDIILTSALTILSGCVPNVYGIYDQRITYPNIYSFIIAPAANGKGVMNFARQLGNVYHKSIKDISIEDLRQYKQDMEQYRMEQRSRKKGEAMQIQEPDQPNFRVPFIPANISCAKVLSQLEQNGGGGIICETEADTMSNVFKNDWGSYSDVLRKAFHHEKLSYSRKTNNELIEVETPRLSVLLGGTPNQVFNLIPTSEDGLFSRFIFYVFKGEQVWRSVSPFSNSRDLTSVFNDLSKEVFKIVEFLQNCNTEVKLNRLQWQHLDEHFSKKLGETTAFVDDEAASVVKRMGMITYRIAMTLTALRKGQTKAKEVQQICTDQDFERSLRISNTYLDHALLMYDNLPRQSISGISKGGSDKKRFYDGLPNEFKRMEAVLLGRKLNMSVRKIDGLLEKWKGVQLEYLAHGHYKKYK